jgi:MraZ protein
MDRQGRVRIPTSLAELAGLCKEIVLLGVRDHLEIWDRRRWEGYLNQKQPFYDEIAEGAFGASSTNLGTPATDRPAAEAHTEETRPGQPR